MSFTTRKLRDKPRRSNVWLKRALTVLTIAQPIMGLYRSWKTEHDKDVRNRQRIGFLKRLLLVLVAIFFAVLLLGGIAKAIFTVSGVGFDTVLTVAGAPMPQDTNGHTNFLLIGQGDAGHDGKNLTDTIMIASIDPEDTGATVLLSLPRDLYFLSTEKMGKGKLNSMYRDFRSFLIFQRGMEEGEAEVEAIRELASEVGRKMNIEIHHAAKVDFIAFEKAVDTIGGVDIEVPYDIEDLEYPDENYGFEPFIIRAGPRHLDGATALKYARSRHTTSDFGRSARQQQLLGAMAHKAKEEGVLKDAGAITSFMNIMKENVVTTMTLRELIGAAGLAQKLDRSKLITMQLNDRNALYDGFIEPGGMLYTPPRDLFEGAAVLLPVSIPEFPITWKQPQALGELLFRNRTVYLEQPSFSVLNAGAPPGMARRVATELIRYGFDVTTIENAETEKRETTMIVAPLEPDPVVDFFANMLNVPKEASPADLPDTQKERITIILGSNFRYTPIQDLIE